MALRTITYGYEMKDGKITVCASEAEVIEQIYRSYAAGMTFVQIASELTELSVRYFGDNSQWNKNMVHRIVGNARYIGDDGYPPILDEELYNAAVKRKEEKACVQKDASPLIDYLRENVKCGACGGRMKRIGKWRSREKWMCACGCKSEISLSDKYLTECIISTLNRAIENPTLLRTKSDQDTYIPSQAVVRQGKEIDRLLDQADLKFNIVKQAILEYARMKFECCTENPADAYTEYIVEKMQRSKLTKLDESLLKDVCAKILYNMEGTVTIEFKNSVQITGNKEDKKDERSYA